MRKGHVDVAELIHAARQGATPALERLLVLYRNYLGLLARRGLGSTLGAKADPSDIVQEAMLRACRDFPQFCGGTEAELTAWLRRILANCLAGLGRRFRTAAARDVARERPIEDILYDSSTALGNLVQVREPTPSQAAQRRERSVMLADALAELPADYRRVIVLRSIEQRAWGEVASRMERTPGAVRMLWTRGLKQLATVIEDRT